MSVRVSVVASVTAIALTSLASRTARADMTKEQCVEANAKAQDLARDGRLLAASQELHLCAVPACPALIRDDCTRRLDEVVRDQPSFIFDVKESSGVDLIDVHVSMDGQLLTERLDGKPLKVDPGVHTFTFEVAGRAPINRRLLVKEGESGRQEHVVFKGPMLATVAPAPKAPATPPPVEPIKPTDLPPPPSPGLGGQRVAGLTMGAVGLAGVGVGAVFGILASSAWSKTKTDCGGHPDACGATETTAADADRTTTVRDATVSTVGFVAGGALVAGGLILFLTGGRHDGGAAAYLAPDVGRGQAGLVLRGQF